MQKDFIRIHAVLGGKNPHPQTFLVGGMATAMDPNEPAPSSTRNITFLQRAGEAHEFVNQVYIPDVLAIAGFYKDWFTMARVLGITCPTAITLGDNHEEPERFLFPRGIVLGRDLARYFRSIPNNITEYVTRSWYSTRMATAAKHPRKAKPIRSTPARSLPTNS